MPGHVLCDVLQIRAAPDGETAKYLTGSRALLFEWGADHKIEMSVVNHDLVGVPGFVVGAQHLACGRIQSRHRFAVAQRDIHRIAHRHETPGQFRRPTAEGPQVVLPGRYFLLPEQYAAKRIAGNEHPFRRRLYRGDRAFVDDIEKPPCTRNRCAKA